MKNKLYLIIFTTIIIFMSCEKEEYVPVKQENSQASKFESEGKFKEEMIVTDESGRNQAFYAIYSDDKDLLAEYIKHYEFTLKVNEFYIEELRSLDLNKSKSTLKSSTRNFDLTQKSKITVELVTTNLEDNVISYSLEINNKKLKSANDFIVGYPVSYTTSNDFIGAVHNGSGYEFIAQFEYKTGPLSGWKDFVVNGGNSWWVYPQDEYYISFDVRYHKRRIIIYPCYYQHTVNYHIAYSNNDFRSRTCELGTYDYNAYGECYVGTAPEGTNAFIWGPNQNDLNFYYTPINGNECPMAGSSFDGANCFVMHIPSGCEPYIWQRNWLVKSNIADGTN